MSGGFREHSEGCPTDPSLRRVSGCDENAPVPRFELDGVKHYRCPYFYLTEDVWEFLAYYGHFRSGFLPDAGGIADQAAVFIQACSVMAGELARIEKKKAERGSVSEAP